MRSMSVSIGDILQAVLGHSTAKIRVEVDEGKLRPVDMPVLAADIRKVQEATGWTPQIGLRQTIRETLDDWRKIV